MTDRGYLHLESDSVVRKRNSAAYHYTPRQMTGFYYYALLVGERWITKT